MDSPWRRALCDALRRLRLALRRAHNVYDSAHAIIAIHTAYTRWCKLIQRKSSVKIPLAVNDHRRIRCELITRRVVGKRVCVESELIPNAEIVAKTKARELICHRLRAVLVTVKTPKELLVALS